MNPNDGIVVMSQNTRSLNANFEALKLFVEDESPDIVCVQETREVIGNYEISGYQRLECKTRSQRTGGGVGFWAKEGLQYHICKDLSPFIEGHYESQCLVVRGRKKAQTAIVVNIYRPPDGNMNLFFENLSNQLTYIENNLPNATKIILGDINVDFKGNRCNRLKEFLQGNNLQQVVENVTRRESGTIIDHIYVNIGMDVKATCIDSSVSDHDAVIANIPTFQILKAKAENHAFSYSDNRIENVRRELNCIPWTEKMNELNVNECAELLTEKLQYLTNKHCKTEKGKRKKFNLPKSLKNLRARVHTKFTIWNSDRSNESKERSYKLLKKRYEEMLKKFRQTRLESSLMVQDKRKLWQNIKAVTCTGKPKQNQKIELTAATDTVPNTFNNYFSTIATKIHNEMEIPEGDPTGYMKQAATNFAFQQPNTLDTHKILKSLKPKRSSGYDEISSKLLKELHYDLIQPIKIILNKMYTEGKFPQCWKKAKIVPVAKKGDPKEAGNYRPISLLPALSKLAEKSMASQIYKYMEDNNLFPQTQFGFRKGKSTTHAVNNLIYEMEHLNHKKENYALIMIDFSKAFDLIDHKILFQKLSKLGFDPHSITLLKSYLTNREQYVYCNGEHSEIKELSAVGCPQGSILGPLLYLIYTIDIKDVINKHFHIMFADDTGLIVRLNNKAPLKDLAMVMETLLKHFTRNKLKMNVTKTIILGKGISGEINISNNKLDIKETSLGERYLGVLINPNLTWQKHFEDTCNGVKRGLHALAKIKKIRNINVKKSVYEAFIKSRIMFSITSWYPGLKQSQKNTLERLNKAAIRLIAGKHRKAHSAELYKKLELLRVEDLYTQSVISTIRKLREPCNYNNNLLNYMQIIETNTRSNLRILPKRKGKTLASHTKIGTEHADLIQSHLCTDTIMGHLRKNILERYRTICDRATCYSCNQTNPTGAPGR